VTKTSFVVHVNVITHSIVMYHQQTVAG